MSIDYMNKCIDLNKKVAGREFQLKRIEADKLNENAARYTLDTELALDLAARHSFQVLMCNGVKSDHVIVSNGKGLTSVKELWADHPTRIAAIRYAIALSYLDLLKRM